jgi:predicted choloylglycine hydrolase
MEKQMNELQIIECSGTPLEMGRQYGEQAREAIQVDLELRKQYWNVDSFTSFSIKAEKVLKQYLPDVLEELGGIAEGAGVDLHQVLYANQVDTFGDNVERCTPVILRNAPEGTIIAKNNDAPVNEDFPFIIRKCKPGKGIPFMHVTYAGWLSGLDCINAEGLANTHGSVGSVFDKSGMRVDIRLKAYQLMHSCRTTDEFIVGLNETPLTGKGFNIAVGDAENNTAMLDAAVPFIAVSARNKKFDYATNIYKSPGLENADMRPPEKRDICVYRYGYLKWLEETNPPENLDDIKKLLSCHEPWAPCRHGGPHGSKTLWSMINLTKSGKMLITHGSPCRNEYKEYSI